MKVHYKTAFAVAMIVLGGILLLLNLYLMSVTSRMSFQLIMGILVLILGFSFLKRPMFELRDNEIVLFNAFGMIVKRYTFDSFDELSVVDNKVYVDKNGKRQRVRVGSYAAKKDEWDLFLSKIDRKSFSAHSDLLDDI